MRREICYDGADEKISEMLSEVILFLNFFSEAMSTLKVFEDLFAILIKQVSLTKDGDYFHLSESVIPGSTTKFCGLFSILYIPSGEEEYRGIKVAQLDFPKKSLIWDVPLGTEMQADRRKTFSEIFRKSGFKIFNEGGD